MFAFILSLATASAYIVERQDYLNLYCDEDRHGYVELDSGFDDYDAPSTRWEVYDLRCSAMPHYNPKGVHDGH